jgi:hypothetical protein
VRVHKPAKLEKFVDSDGDTWIRHTTPGQVVWPKINWVAFLENGRLKGFEVSRPERICARLNRLFSAPAIQAIAALWVTFDRPEVFRTKVDGRSVRFVKSEKLNTVHLCGRGFLSTATRKPDGKVGWSGCFEGIDGASIGGWVTAFSTAIDHFWGPELRHDHVPTKAESADGWSFTCTPDKIDIARCLREAYAAGFREIVIDEVPQYESVWFHRSVWGLLADSGEAQNARNWSATSLDPDWAPCSDKKGALTRARAWEAAQAAKAPEPVKKVDKPKTPTVTITLKGTC